MTLLKNYDCPGPTCQGGQVSIHVDLTERPPATGATARDTLSGRGGHAVVIFPRYDYSGTSNEYQVPTTLVWCLKVSPADMCEARQVISLDPVTIIRLTPSLKSSCHGHELPQPSWGCTASSLYSASAPRDQSQNGCKCFL